MNVIHCHWPLSVNIFYYSVSVVWRMLENAKLLNISNVNVALFSHSLYRSRTKLKMPAFYSLFVCVMNCDPLIQITIKSKRCATAIGTYALGRRPWTSLYEQKNLLECTQISQIKWCPFNWSVWSRLKYSKCWIFGFFVLLFFIVFESMRSIRNNLSGV